MGKERDFEQFIDILKEATSRVEPEYFLLPVASQEDAIYRERVYCYELYHKLREVFEEHTFLYSLAGEVDKNGHTIIYPKIRAKKPDLIVHWPGRMGKNLVVIEVKSIKARTDKIKEDLDTLTDFITKANYFRAIHLVYGNTEEKIKRYIHRSFGKEHLEFSNSLCLFWHKAPQDTAEIYDWARILIKDLREQKME